MTLTRLCVLTQRGLLSGTTHSLTQSVQDSLCTGGQGTGFTGYGYRAFASLLARAEARERTRKTRLGRWRRRHESRVRSSSAAPRVPSFSRTSARRLV